MARPKADFPAAEAIRALLDDAGCLALRVTPGARVECLDIVDGRLIAKVRVPPEAGKANEAVIALVARALGTAPSRLALVRGQQSRDKLIRVDCSS